jgi:hypothetical protein
MEKELIRKLIDLIQSYDEPKEDSATPQATSSTPPTTSTPPVSPTPPSTGNVSFGKGRMNVSTGDSSSFSLGKGPTKSQPPGAYMNFGSQTGSGQVSAGIGKGSTSPGAPSGTQFNINFSKKF